MKCACGPGNEAKNLLRDPLFQIYLRSYILQLCVLMVVGSSEKAGQEGKCQ